MGNEMEMMVLMLLYVWNKRNEKGFAKLLLPWQVFIKKMNEWGCMESVREAWEKSERRGLVASLVSSK
jgi:hypothetical protein